MKRKHYNCSKNFVAKILQDGEHCGGPRGVGVEKICSKNCTNFCNSKKTLFEKVEWVFYKWDSTEEEIKKVNSALSKLKQYI